MDKKFICWVKQKFPLLFEFVTKSVFLSKLCLELDRVRFIYCMVMKKPYFGTVMLAGQTWVERRYFMRRLVEDQIRRVNRKEFVLLEIGSWVGNSAILWAEAIKASNCSGKIICVDPWEAYTKTLNQEHVNVAINIMDEALKKGKVFNLFLHNVKTSGHHDVVHPIKAPSGDILPLLVSGSFDVVYIDGDHSYTGMMSDLTASSRLVVEGGIISGDDLDIDIDSIDRAYALEHKEINCVVDPKTNQRYTPGVCLAVSDFFNVKVSSYNGFWAMRKKAGGWEQVELK